MAKRKTSQKNHKKSMRTKEKKKSTDSPIRSFSSLPEDIIVNCLARVSNIHYPTLCLVSKEFKSLVTSRELYATRSRIGKTENFLCICLNLTKESSNPRWFIFSQIPKQQKLLPLPWFPLPHQHPKSSTVVSTGSEIYVIGGFVESFRSQSVWILDYQTRQWRRINDMLLHRVSPAADVIDGKMIVIGGCKREKIGNWGEVYDPKSQTWKPLLPTTQDLTSQKSVVPGRLVMGGKAYAMGTGLFPGQLYDHICLVEIENELCQISTLYDMINWYDVNEVVGCKWKMVKGLEKLNPNPYFPNEFIKVTNSGGGKNSRAIVWWRSVVGFRRQGRHWSKEHKTNIWCAEVSFDKRGGLNELWGSVEWSKNVYTFDGCDKCDTGLDFILHSAFVSL